MYWKWPIPPIPSWPHFISFSATVWASHLWVMSELFQVLCCSVQNLLSDPVFPMVSRIRLVLHTCPTLRAAFSPQPCFWIDSTAAPFLYSAGRERARERGTLNVKDNGQKWEKRVWDTVRECTGTIYVGMIIISMALINSAQNKLSSAS